MKKIIRGFTYSGVIFVAALLVGCIGNPYTDNPYLTSQIYSDPGAPYVGEWTTAAMGPLTSIKIKEDGSTILCSADEHFGETVGKVIKKNNEILLTFEMGGPYSIGDISENHLTLKMYGTSYLFYRGQVAARCLKVFNPPDSSAKETERRIP